MSTKFKYIVLIVRGEETPVIFPAWAQHKDFVPANTQVVAAGYLYFIATQEKVEGAVSASNQINFICHGDSHSLKVSSRNDVDSKLIHDYWLRTLS